jgi:suppressor for copper-sensitivity B
MNIMPCVLPILGIKIASIAKQRSQHSVRKSLIFTIFGIIVTFLTLGIATNLLFGGVKHWGAGFQNPFFIAIMLGVVFIAMLLHNGVLNVGNIGGKWLLGVDFSEGIMATLLATPCLAPLFTGAMVFSANNLTLTIIVFICCGVGFALPYIIMLFGNDLSGKIIKTKFGIWLYRSVPTFMLITFLWLLYVLNGQIGMSSVVLIAMAALVGALLLHRVMSFFVRWVLVVGLIGAFVAVVAIKPSFFANKEDVQTNWRTLSNEDLDKAILHNNIVLVNITADWCITCKINKATSLSNSSFVEFVASNDIVLMEGDMTSDNTEASNFLRENGGKGLPFVAIYSPSNPSGRVLNNVLTPAYIIDELKKELQNAGGDSADFNDGATDDEDVQPSSDVKKAAMKKMTDVKVPNVDKKQFDAQAIINKNGGELSIEDVLRH